MFAIIAEMRARLQEIDDRQARLEMTTQDTCNNVANLQKTVAETQELVMKCMVTLKQAFEQIKIVCQHMSENIEDIEPGQMNPFV